MAIFTFLLWLLLGLVITLPVAALLASIWLAVRTSEYRKVASLYIRSTLNFLIEIPIILLGLPIVAIALPFRTTSGESIKFTQYPEGGFWQMVSLPKWALLWDNPCDGAVGDTRGWWDNYCRKNYNKTCRSFYSMWRWMAIRNSANYWSRIICGVDASITDVVITANGKYWQFLEGTRRTDSKQFYLFEGFIPYLNSTHGFEWRLGWKIEEDDQPKESESLSGRMVGSVYRIRPWKDV